LRSRSVPSRYRRRRDGFRYPDPGAIVVGLAIWLEVAFEPPIWVHLVVWVPAILIMSIAMLRPFKGILIGMHYKNLRHKYHTGNDA
jgi:uncharacterized protein (DUF983 family)